MMTLESHWAIRVQAPELRKCTGRRHNSDVHIEQRTKSII
jgi:hypothetical protein